MTPKATVLDPQGQAVQHAMQSIGYAASNTHIGKVITFEIKGQDTPEFRAALDTLCNNLLSNPIIEDYRYTIEPQHVAKSSTLRCSRDPSSGSEASRVSNPSVKQQRLQ